MDLLVSFWSADSFDGFVPSLFIHSSETNDIEAAVLYVEMSMKKYRLSRDEGDARVSAFSEKEVHHPRESK